MPDISPSASPSRWPPPLAISRASDWRARRWRGSVLLSKRQQGAPTRAWSPTRPLDAVDHGDVARRCYFVVRARVGGTLCRVDAFVSLALSALGFYASVSGVVGVVCCGCRPWCVIALDRLSNCICLSYEGRAASAFVVGAPTTKRRVGVGDVERSGGTHRATRIQRDDIAPPRLPILLTPIDDRHSNL